MKTQEKSKNSTVRMIRKAGAAGQKTDDASKVPCTGFLVLMPLIRKSGSMIICLQKKILQTWKKEKILWII